MKKLSLLAVLLFAGIVMSAQKFNDPNAEIRTASGFHGINVSSSFDVYLSQGNNEAVAVSAASASDRAKINVEVKDGILVIGLDKSVKWNTGNKKLKAYISFKQIDKITVSGACDVIITGVLKSERLSVNQSGACDMKGALDVEKMDVVLSGASDMNVSGKASRIKMELSGASDFKGFDFNTDVCDIDASGASDVKVTVNKELNAKASGASDIMFKGEGEVKTKKTSGAASVSKA